MAWDSAVVTNAGVEMLNNVLSGGQLTLDYATAGSGTVDAAALMLQTAISDEKAQFPIVALKRVSQGQRVNIQITNVGLAETFQMKQLGIWAHVDAEETKLLAILQDSKGIAIQSETELEEFSLNFYAVIAFDGEANFNLTLDPSTLVTLALLEERTEGMARASDLEAHTGNTDIHVTAEEKEAWNNQGTNLETHTKDTNIHVTAEEKEAWNNQGTDLETHTKDTDIHVTAAEKKAWNNQGTDLETHTKGTDIHVTAEEKEAWNKQGTDLEAHTKNTDIHVTVEEKEAWNNKAPMYTYSQTDLTAGSSPLETGKIHLVYE